MDFSSGETVTIEAWIDLKSIKGSGDVLLVGKGSAGALNYGLTARLENVVYPAFQYSVLGEEGNGELEQLKWRALYGLPLDSGWHHFAVTYEFGDPESLRLYLDGRRQPGSWTSTLEPCLDQSPAENDSPLRFMSPSGTTRITGSITEAKVSRKALQDNEMAERFSVPVPYSPSDYPENRVAVELLEEVPFSHGWIFDTSECEPIYGYDETAFGFYQLPNRYVGTGVRGSWPSPMLVRATSRVELPKGRHTILLRAHSTARLSVDGEKLGEISYRQFDEGSQNPVDFVPVPPTRETRRLAPACREVLLDFQSDGGSFDFMLEVRLGGRSVRTGDVLRNELGETVVAVRLEGEDGFSLLAPSAKVPLTDAGWIAFANEREEYYRDLDKRNRVALRAKFQKYWDDRHSAAKAYVLSLPNLELPNSVREFEEANYIDRFINAEIDRVLQLSEKSDAVEGAVDFHKDVLPIFEAHCISCHGSKEKGGLRLDQRASAFKGGESELPGIVAGQPEESEILYRILTDDSIDVMPAKGERLSASESGTIRKWIEEGAVWPDEPLAYPSVTPSSSDEDFVRRVYLDVVGQVPTKREFESFLADKRPEKRRILIDKLLDDPRWADNWVGYWQDLLAENPSLVNMTLNVTGPFRWWIHESFLDNKPMDLFATELITMRGASAAGGPAGFGLAAENDAPEAEKAAIINAAFLGVQMKCARCHDAPFHSSTQEDLFSMAAMLNEGPLSVPDSSSVPSSVLDKPNSLIKVTLPPGVPVDPKWPLDGILRPEDIPEVVGSRATTRDTYAAAVTSPTNLRFARVIANRLWERYFGRGLMKDADDWEVEECLNPNLLEYLARELMLNGYDLKHLARLILNSKAYQRSSLTDEDSNRLFAAPPRRMMSSEQIVDSMTLAFGLEFDTEPLNLDLFNAREFILNQNLERPVKQYSSWRAWEMAGTPLDRDRPSLMLPRVQAVTDLMGAFGWRSSRYEPISCREVPMNPLQPANLANGVYSLWLTGLSDESQMTELALSDISLDELINTVFVRVLSRPPKPEERNAFANLLKIGYTDRRVSKQAVAEHAPVEGPIPVLAWNNHLSVEAVELRREQVEELESGPVRTKRLKPDWRNRFEDALWALLNSPETISIP